MKRLNAAASSTSADRDEDWGSRSSVGTKPKVCGRKSLFVFTIMQVATPLVVAKIEQYKRDNPSIFAWEIRENLIDESEDDMTSWPSTSSDFRCMRATAERLVD